MQLTVNPTRRWTGILQTRFLHRVQKFKVDLHLELLKEYGFEANVAGFKLMERRVGEHMANPAVAGKAKRLMEIIMGDIW